MRILKTQTAAAPIFVVGLPRSGSTLIEQILASHSQIEGTAELPELGSLANDLASRDGADDDEEIHGYFEQVLRLDGAGLRDLGRRYMECTRIHRKTNKPFFIDKMPNNFAHVGLIHLILPHAVIIDARRHPMATCFSGSKQHFSRGQGFSYDLKELGNYYRDYVDLMSHYDEALPGRVYRTFYENLIDNPEAQVRQLLAHCGIAFENACLEFHKNERPVRTASSEQVRQPLNCDGAEHWKYYEPWLGELEHVLGATIPRYLEMSDTQRSLA